jgi:hypothetical protein
VKKESEEINETVLNAQANRRLIELLDTAAPNFDYPGEDEIACYLLNRSPVEQACGEAMLRPFSEGNYLEKD